MSQDDGASVDSFGDKRYASGYSTGHAEGMEELLRMMAKFTTVRGGWNLIDYIDEIYWEHVDYMGDEMEIHETGTTAQSLIDYLKRE